jgi:hypothetical protein
MTPASFLARHDVSDNPFRAEEARQDSVLARIVGTPDIPPVDPRLTLRAQHGDFEKIVGDLRRPSSCVVFGEKGSGKTTIRLQLARAVAQHNANWVDARVLLVAYDDLNPFLERLHARLRRTTRKGETPVVESLRQMQLTDHVDAILSLVVPRAVSGLLEEGRVLKSPDALEFGPTVRATARKLDWRLRRDLLLLQAVYDRPDNVAERTRQLRRVLGARRSPVEWVERAVALLGWLVPLLIGAWVYVRTLDVIARGQFPSVDAGGLLHWRYWLGLTEPRDVSAFTWSVAFFASLLIWLMVATHRWWVDRVQFAALVRRVTRQVRVSGRSERSVTRALRAIPRSWRRGTGAAVPTRSDEGLRIGLLQRLRTVLTNFGYSSIVVVVDRADEPGLVAGDVERMKAVVWPILSNALLQEEGVALKLLLPIELRHLVFRESSAFFQQARMDKQSLVDELAWTGPMLYDLCDTRLAACTEPGKTPPTLSDLFAPEISRDALIDALEQMRNPRDACKLVYQCITEHCATQTTAGAGDGAYRIGRATLERVRKEQAERVRQLAMGIRPA